MQGRSSGASDPVLERTVPVLVQLDLRRTLGVHRRGPGDPAMRFAPDGSVWRATRTVEGPATLQLLPRRDMVVARAWGAGATIALAGVTELLGLSDEPESLVPHHPAVAVAARQLRGVRFGRTNAVFEALVPAILEQKITGDEARLAWRSLVVAYGEEAPGPGGLMVPPSAAVLARLPYHAFHPLGIERRRARVISAVATEAPRLERLALQPALAAGDVDAALTALPGVGAWTAAEVRARAFGDPDAVSVGDYHLPHLVAWALAGEPRGTDERMLELLAPYAGHRGRVTRLLELGGPRPARRAPRMALRRIGRI